MADKIEVAIDYYTKQGKEILEIVNSKTDLTADEIIHYGEEMAIIEYKLTALEVAKEN
ncbi:hypothetical protein [Winogradskyella sp. UBA3174]|uniref:hypothetical protein n=1 Tax=Winogradskyella sp. UBA3174 TaxID=1947785 RepID=UPI0025F7230F|nr:hypothetical protein [Winogradskyella sp. UBA3174]|tara:strand:+ start:73402 stop:73575 length:174 start_codon:yes stop_codon:yes gene_type:complete